MENEIENQDSSNLEKLHEGINALEGDALNERLQRISDSNRQLFERAKKAEVEAKELRLKVKPEPKPEAQPKLEAKEPTDWNDSQKSLLLALKVDPQDFDFVKEEVKKFNGSLNGADLIELSNNQYFANKLSVRTTERANAKASSGSGSGNRSGTGGEESVEYWMGKLSPTEAVPANLPTELREKIVDARMQKGKYQKEFYNS